MTPPEFEYLRRILKDISGLDLSADKQYLIERRGLYRPAAAAAEKLFAAGRRSRSTAMAGFGG